jgi:hypothetical protein
MREEINGGLVIFYDSVIHSGELKFQSQLNENNLVMITLLMLLGIL